MLPGISQGDWEAAVTPRMLWGKTPETTQRRAMGKANILAVGSICRLGVNCSRRTFVIWIKAQESERIALVDRDRDTGCCLPQKCEGFRRVDRVLPS
jgi:hypothetical protein